MSRYLLDTSAYSHFKRGDAQVVKLVDSSIWLGLPAVVLGELETGFLLGKAKHLEENRAGLREFLDNPVVEEVGLDQGVSRIYAEIVVALRRVGTPVPINDVWIAAIAVRAGVTVLTYDDHFRMIPRVDSLILTPPPSREKKPRKNHRPLPA